jgi:glycosyltransferase involved in cell wall biosynthesis
MTARIEIQSDGCVPYPINGKDAGIVLVTVLLPFFNEHGWIGATLDSLARQTDRRFRLLLLDNGSSDDSRTEVRSHLAAHPGLAADLRTVSVPGKVNALAAGLAEVATPYVAVCDADTRYPPDYIARSLSLFAARPEAAAVMAIDLYAPSDAPESKWRIRRILDKCRHRPSCCHAGGCAQVYRTRSLKAAGGFDAARWPFILEDHEIAYRLLKTGPIVYDADFYCFPAPRRRNHRNVNWSWYERWVYRHTPMSRMDWFFYDFLRRRLERRGAYATILRKRDWA